MQICRKEIIMANHPKRSGKKHWSEKWTVINDTEKGVQVAIHESDLVIDFSVSQEANEGIATFIPRELSRDFTLDKARRLSRLMKEANDLWSEQNEPNKL